MEKNANQFTEMYASMGITLDKLGCIMLDLDGSIIENKLAPEDLYFSSNPLRFWIKGFVAGHTPHVTLLYGLLKSGNTEYREYVDKVLEGWECEAVEIDHIGFFPSPYEDEEYYCIVAHLKITDELKQANQLLQLLPHINTFPGYKAHITIAYIRKNAELRDRVIAAYEYMLAGKELPVTELNYGK